MISLRRLNNKQLFQGVYIAGDLSGIEEASTAMEEGRLAGLSAAESLGYLGKSEFEEKAEIIRQRLLSLRSGPFGEARRKAKRDMRYDT